MHDTGRSRQERLELPLRACRGTRLERAAAREHDRDDRTGEVLADDERADERQHRQRVDAEAAVPGRVDHPPGRGHDPDDRVDRPDRVRGVVEPGEVQDPAGREQCDRDDQEYNLRVGA